MQAKDEVVETNTATAADINPFDPESDMFVAAKLALNPTTQPEPNTANAADINPVDRESDLFVAAQVALNPTTPPAPPLPPPDAEPLGCQTQLDALVDNTHIYEILRSLRFRTSPSRMNIRPLFF